MRRSVVLLCLLSLPLLSACENNAAGYEIEGRNHSITLVREQSYPLARKVRQSLIVARIPTCQRRIEIVPGKTGQVNMEIWQLRDRLFVARQGTSWYAVGTENCQIQKMDPTGDEPPGQLIGNFRVKEGEFFFDKAPAAAPAAAQSK